MSSRRSFDRKRRMARVDPRIPKKPGRTLGQDRRLRGLLDEVDDAPAQPRGFISDVSRRLGPKGRFLAAAILIGITITAGDLALERYSTNVATNADYANAAQVGLGQNVYETHCAYCHGADLKGQAGWDGAFPNGDRPALPLDGSGPIARLSDQDLFAVTKYGGQPFSPPEYRNTMPAFEDALADSDIWAVLAYIKSRWSPETLERQQEITVGG